ncbi:MAG: hypothetical protein ACJAYU_000669 [Bradymonadia bacterium]|jgi:hypothetical protein
MPRISHRLFALTSLLTACGTAPGDGPGIPQPPDAPEPDAESDTAPDSGLTERDATGDATPIDVSSPDVAERDAREDTAPIDEICDNGFDEDGDGAIDCTDPDCSRDAACLNTCGVVRAVCTIEGSGAPAESDLFVLPLDSLSCTLDLDSDQVLETVEWSVASAPPGSTSEFLSLNGLESAFFVDLAGRYVLIAFATFNDGCTSESAVSLVSRPGADIHVQLVWNTPADPDETDVGPGAGTDLDLHYRTQDGCWEDRIWDCHNRNVSPNWGDTGTAEDDPSLEADDTDGAGPENINHDNPTNGFYQVAVQYTEDHGFGTSYATVRIYLFGELAFEARDKEMQEGDWWIAAGVNSPSTELTPIDLEYDDVPPCGLK